MVWWVTVWIPGPRITSKLPGDQQAQSHQQDPVLQLLPEDQLPLEVLLDLSLLLDLVILVHLPVLNI